MCACCWRQVPYRGPVEATLLDLLGGLRYPIPPTQHSRTRCLALIPLRLPQHSRTHPRTRTRTRAAFLRKATAWWLWRAARSRQQQCCPLRSPGMLPLPFPFRTQSHTAGTPLAGAGMGAGKASWGQGAMP